MNACVAGLRVGKRAVRSSLRTAWTAAFLVACVRSGVSHAGSPSTCAPESADLTANRVSEAAAASKGGVSFAVEGIGNGGVIHPGVLRIIWTLAGYAKPISAQHVDAVLHLPGGVTVDVRPWVDVEAGQSVLRLRLDDASPLVVLVRNARVATLVHSMSTEDWNDVYTFSQDLTYSASCEPSR